jgi:hypothetical protein
MKKFLEMKGDKKSINLLLVKWLGYDETYNSWEPWKNVRDTDKVHDYLRANNMELYTKEVPNKYISFLSRLLQFYFFCRQT